VCKFLLAIATVQHYKDGDLSNVIPFLRYSNNAVQLKSVLWVILGHWKWHHSIDHIRVPVRFSLYGHIVSEIKRDIGQISRFKKNTLYVTLLYFTTEPNPWPICKKSSVSHI